MLLSSEAETEPLLNPHVDLPAQDRIVKQEDVQAWSTRLVALIRRFAHLRLILLLLFIDQASNCAAGVSSVAFLRALACEDYFATHPNELLLVLNDMAYEPSPMERTSPHQLCALPEIESKVIWLLTVYTLISMSLCLVMMAFVYGNLLPVMSKRTLIVIAVLGQLAQPLAFSLVPHSFPYGPIYESSGSVAAAWCSPRISLVIIAIACASGGLLASDILVRTIASCIIVNATTPDIRSQALALARGAPVLGVIIWPPAAQFLAEKMPLYKYWNVDYESSSLNVTSFVFVIALCTLVIVLTLAVLPEEQSRPRQMTEDASTLSQTVSIWTTLRAARPYRDSCTGLQDLRMPILMAVAVLCAIGENAISTLIAYLGYVGASEEFNSLVISAIGVSLALGLCLVVPTLYFLVGAVIQRGRSLMHAPEGLHGETRDSQEEAWSLIKAEKVDFRLLQISLWGDATAWAILALSAYHLSPAGLLTGISSLSIGSIMSALISSLGVSWVTKRHEEAKRLAVPSSHSTSPETEEETSAAPSIPTSESVIACLSLANVFGLFIGPLALSGLYSLLLPSGHAALTLVAAVVAYGVALLLTFAIRR